MCAGAMVNARVARLIRRYDPKAGFWGTLGNLVQDSAAHHRWR